MCFVLYISNKRDSKKRGVSDPVSGAAIRNPTALIAMSEACRQSVLKSKQHQLSANLQSVLLLAMTPDQFATSRRAFFVKML